MNECATNFHTKHFVELAKFMAKKYNLKVKVLDAKKILKEGLNLIHAVGNGSKYPPYLVILEYLGDPASEDKFVVVGKGVTFDTGGLNLKPSKHIQGMHQDMAGAATVIGIMKSLSELNIKKNVIGVIPTVENMIGPDAYKPNDIIKAYNGQSVEIGNTDAEGRLILADAISYAIEKYSPKLVIDLATLTGAIIYALGHTVCGMFSNSREYSEKMFSAGQKTFERVWELPTYEDYMENLKSEFADIKNVGPSGVAGAINGAMFLKSFVGNTPWIHLDIAGVAFLEKDDGYLPVGGTGFGVRLVIEFLKNA